LFAETGVNFWGNDVFGDRDIRERPRFVDINGLVFSVLRWSSVIVVIGKGLDGGRGYDRRSTFLLGITRALDGCSTDPSSGHR